MENFIVSARKYRPQNFSTVIGQAHITTTLKNAINNNQLAHAFLFCGPRGVGKTTCARILAKTINCENRTKEGEACNTCNSCVSFDNGISMNIHELDAASNNSVEDIRTLVDQVRFAPQAGKYKVYIVDEVHMLSQAAFNAFLKTLEEPPHFAIFILATTEKHKILPTILSRCQIFDFKRITINDTIVHLQEICDKEDITAEKAGLHVIAQKSEGCMRDALSILDKIASFTGGKIDYANTLEHLNILDEDYYFRLMDHLQQQQLAEALLLFDEINQKGFEGDTFLEGFAEFIRNLLISRDVKAAGLLEVADDFREKYLHIAQQVSAGWLIAALNLLSDANIGYRQSRNKRLFVEMVLIKLNYLGQAIQLVSDDQQFEKKKLTEQTKVLSFRALPVMRIKQPASVVKPERKQPVQEARLVIDKPEPATHEQVSVTVNKVSGSGKSSNRLGSLEKIRNQVMQERNAGNNSKPVTEESLRAAWDAFIEKLSHRKNHSAVTNFRMADLHVADDNSFDIITSSNMHQKFIEAERSDLIHFMQAYFNNRLLTYQLILVEKEVPAESTGQPLTTKQQYQKLSEEYPLIKELRDRLKLDLDF